MLWDNMFTFEIHGTQHNVRTAEDFTRRDVGARPYAFDAEKTVTNGHQTVRAKMLENIRQYNNVVFVVFFVVYCLSEIDKLNI